MASGRTESETCRELILPALLAAGWADDQIIEEFRITDGRILPLGDRHRRDRPLRADYVLEVKGVPVAIVEAKRTTGKASDGIGQARVYAQLLDIPLAYASDGTITVRIDMATGQEDFNARFPTPAEAWSHFQSSKGLTQKTAGAYTEPFNRELRLSDGRVKEPRYYQRIAINRTVQRVLAGDKRLLVVMATGTGKSFLAMQIAWKLQRTGWIESRKPRILYLADRNVLIDQPRQREFVPVFGENAIHKFAGEMKTGRDIYFGLYQNLGAGQDSWYRGYPPDYFDAIIVDECHRGSSRDDSAWRLILEYFGPATQIGLTATPIVNEDADTYRHFGRPIFEYSLAQGINDGFLAPYAVRRVVLSADAFGFAPEEGQLDLFGNEIPEGLYETAHFERVVSLLTRTDTAAAHLTDYLKRHGRDAKTIIFCVNSEHADAMRRALHNANSDITAGDPDYVVRIVSAEYERDRLFSQFSDPERQSPTIATTSQLLSTGVDIPAVRNIVLFRPVGSMALFKQIIGRGTRLDPDTNKWQFEIIDYCGATRLFEDPEFDGPPLVETDEEIDDTGQVVDDSGEVNEPDLDFPGDAEPDEPDEQDLDDDERARKFYVDDEPVWIVAQGVYCLDPNTRRLRLVQYQSFVADSVRRLVSSAAELRERWGQAGTREEVIDALTARGIDLDDALDHTGLHDADPLDLLVHLAWNEPLASRFDRVRRVRAESKAFFENYSPEARLVLDELLNKYGAFGPGELASASLRVPPLSEMGSPVELADRFGGAEELRSAIAALHDELYAA
ncbi:EcoAI/FtnUII family type I restriction enzme subunit R [Candidatus Poriferisocius sp.]|uniref:EcoAI/FtnUII family type I restriction enzme subunit R n=1 Tax=Candidatus Poriferisocius sp. TaxID=3101276 RepID=UPI003B5BE917